MTLHKIWYAIMNVYTSSIVMANSLKDVPASMVNCIDQMIASFHNKIKM